MESTASILPVTSSLSLLRTCWNILNSILSLWAFVKFKWLWLILLTYLPCNLWLGKKEQNLSFWEKNILKWYQFSASNSIWLYCQACVLILRSCLEGVCSSIFSSSTHLARKPELQALLTAYVYTCFQRQKKGRSGWLILGNHLILL